MKKLFLLLISFFMMVSLVKSQNADWGEQENKDGLYKTYEETLVAEPSPNIDKSFSELFSELKDVVTSDKARLIYRETSRMVGYSISYIFVGIKDIFKEMKSIFNYYFNIGKKEYDLYKELNKK